MYSPRATDTSLTSVLKESFCFNFQRRNNSRRNHATSARKFHFFKISLASQSGRGSTVKGWEPCPKGPRCQCLTEKVEIFIQWLTNMFVVLSRLIARKAINHDFDLLIVLPIIASHRSHCRRILQGQNHGQTSKRQMCWRGRHRGLQSRVWTSRRKAVQRKTGRNN